MCSSLTRSSCSLKLHLRLRQYAFSEIPTEACGRIQVDPSTKQICQFILHGDEVEAGRATRLELDKHVYVGLGAEIVAQHRTEQRQPADVMATAELGNLLTRYRNATGLQ